ncbi:hypothetical protein [Robertkochia aurantiaca]|uniref:hypothetical protein n=1 Tax=Robertkochia aurantiaca TaxID=2873700 RepID=UPI001CCDAA73|nr:hypothetical protein [Robertkochia sp. 3YJGBD-33]
MKYRVLYLFVCLLAVLYFTTPETRLNTGFISSDPRADAEISGIDFKSIEPWGTVDEKSDTILTNGFRLRKNVYSTDELILHIYRKYDKSLQRVWYRQFDADITVYHQDRLLGISQKLSAILQPELQKHAADQKAVLRDVYVNMLKSEENQLVLEAYYYLPESGEGMTFQIIYNNDSGSRLVRKV